MAAREIPWGSWLRQPHFPGNFQAAIFRGIPRGILDISREISWEMDFPGNDSREMTAVQFPGQFPGKFGWPAGESPGRFPRKSWMGSRISRGVSREIWTRPAGFDRLGPFCRTLSLYENGIGSSSGVLRGLRSVRKTVKGVF